MKGNKKPSFKLLDEFKYFKVNNKDTISKIAVVLAYWINPDNLSKYDVKYPLLNTKYNIFCNNLSANPSIPNIPIITPSIISKYSYFFLFELFVITKYMQNKTTYFIVSHIAASSFTDFPNTNGRIKHTGTKAEAVNLAREISKNQNSELFIHGKNGQIQSRDSYGNDPFPPKG